MRWRTEDHQEAQRRYGEGDGGRHEDGEHNRRDDYGQATVEEAHISSNPNIGNKWALNNDDGKG